MLLGLKRLLVHNLVMGCCAQTPCPRAVCPSCPLPGLLQHGADVQGAPAASARAAPPGWHQGWLLSCLGAGSTSGRVPSLCAWPGRCISSFLAALTRRHVIADRTCPEILLWKHAREISAETIALLCKGAPSLCSRVCFLRERKATCLVLSLMRIFVNKQSGKWDSS